jgi:hypothetical protein
MLIFGLYLDGLIVLSTDFPVFFLRYYFSQGPAADSGTRTELIPVEIEFH